MARTYQNYIENLNEQEQIFVEIGQLVQPYINDFTFVETGNTIKTEFYDDQKNVINVKFHRFKQGSNSFEVEFDINGFSGEAFKTETKHFFKIISTVVQIINTFIQKFNPIQLYIEAFEKQGKLDQKNKIWLQYAKVNLKADGYVIGNQGNGFGIQKNNKLN